MKHLSLKIFILVIIAGIVGIADVIILKRDIEMLSDGYRRINEEYSENLNYSTEIRLLLYNHESIVAKHVTADSPEKYDEYEQQASEIEKQLKVKFEEFGVRMSGGEREQIYHTAYSSFCGYVESAHIAFDLSRAGKKSTASYYVVNMMDSDVMRVNTNFDDLDSFTRLEIASAREEMNNYMTFSQISTAICIPLMGTAILITLIFCVRITTSVDRYKTKLETDIESKNKALGEHNEKMMRIQNNTIIGMANLIESRDGDTGEHVKRTSRYVSMLAKEAQKRGYNADILTDEYIELLGKAAPLHDIGKIAISDTILQKPGKLTPEEFEIMKTHASRGGEIIREVIGGLEDEEYVSIAADVASYHHEKWDGSGYGAGLSGDNIPLCARIMAIADVFDALISKRCYKDAMPLDKAFAIIEESAGNHFDPALAEMFISLRPEIEAYLGKK